MLHLEFSADSIQGCVFRGFNAVIESKTMHFKERMAGFGTAEKERAQKIVNNTLSSEEREVKQAKLLTIEARRTLEIEHPQLVHFYNLWLAIPHRISTIELIRGIDIVQVSEAMAWVNVRRLRSWPPGHPAALIVRCGCTTSGEDTCKDFCFFHSDWKEKAVKNPTAELVLTRKEWSIICDEEHHSFRVHVACMMQAQIDRGIVPSSGKENETISRRIEWLWAWTPGSSMWARYRMFL